MGGYIRVPCSCEHPNGEGCKHPDGELAGFELHDILLLTGAVEHTFHDDDYSTLKSICDASRASDDVFTLDMNQSEDLLLEAQDLIVRVEGTTAMTWDQQQSWDQYWQFRAGWIGTQAVSRLKWVGGDIPELVRKFVRFCEIGVQAGIIECRP